MPIAYPVTLYGCCFKCGGRRSQNRKLIEKHEETCFANPERRACKTCKHDHKEPDCEGCWCLKSERQIVELPDNPKGWSLNSADAYLHPLPLAPEA